MLAPATRESSLTIADIKMSKLISKKNMSKFLYTQVDSSQRALTGENGFVCVEFAAADTEHDVAEQAAFKQRAEVVAQSTLGHLDRCTARLACHVHCLTNHTHLYTQHTRLPSAAPGVSNNVPRSSLSLHSGTLTGVQLHWPATPYKFQ